MRLQDPSLSSWKGHGSQGREKTTNIMAVFKKGKKHPGNYWPISLTSVPRKIMEPVFLEATSKQHERQEGDWEQSAWIYHGQTA